MRMAQDKTANYDGKISMRQSVKGISAAAIIFFTVTVQSARADFSCRDEKSLTVCQPEDLVQNGPKDRIKQSRILFETNNCLVGEISASGQSDWTAATYADEIHVVVRYECQIPQTTVPQSDLGKKQRTTENVNAKYDFACALREFKYFASGFDHFNDGSRSHWDSQGSSRPIPWQKIYSGGVGAHLGSLFKVWCE
ncbi:hypothetical protein SAMN05443247_05493 [Bradyrhizobium erythrophlei]|nr:hypothetical protein SAMN05443247_05493 [Bradyrhizobium erythrophlei]